MSTTRWMAALAAPVALLLGHGQALAGVVISEIHYHPPGSEAALELIELANDCATPEDISGFRFTEGIDFEIPPGTILGKGQSVVIGADAAALAAHYSITNVLGSYTGVLDNGGERLTLANAAGIPVQSLRYDDEGKWPAAADGTGHSLVLRDLLLDSSEPESWTWSPQLGGSPGRENFPPVTGGLEESPLIAAGAVWRYARGSAPFAAPADAWLAPAFDDSAWPEGPSGFGYGDADDATVLDDMRNGYGTVAIRARFTLTADEALRGEAQLHVRYDDGFCAFLNGVAVAGANCPPEPRHDALASGAHEGNVEESFAVPPGSLVAGENVIAILGLNQTVDSTDFTLAPRLTIRRPPAAARAGPLFSERLRSLAGESWIEFFNPLDTPFSLSGHSLALLGSATATYDIPSGVTLAPGGYLVFTSTETGLDLSVEELGIALRDPGGIVLAAEVFDRQPPAGHELDDFAEVRFPEETLRGELRGWVTLTSTRGGPNQAPRTTEIAINEIFYHPPEDRTGEYIELHNLSASPFNLSGFRLDRGVDYAIPAGTILPAGGHLVIADDPALIQTRYGLASVLGPFTGRLRDAGESIRLLDAWGNVADEVRYFDDGDWSAWADGGGSSLELIDPAQDNAVASAWGPSDESAKAPWQRLAYSVPDYVPSSESELHLFLVERGECRIDDVEVRRAGGANHIANGGFETSTAPWRIEGTHVASERITSDAHGGSACLELRASGKGDSTVNRLETDTAPALTRGPYEVSLWARWLRGGSVIVGHGQFTAGPWGGRPAPATNLSGNTLGGRLRMTVPENLGTPGRENSRRRLLIEATGSANQGPVLWDAAHAPLLPGANEPVTVSVRASDPDGIAVLRAHYREGHAGGAFAPVILTPQPDAGPGTRYRGELPALPLGRKVVFYLEARDALGAVSLYPPEAPARTLLYQVQAPLTSHLETISVVLDEARTQELTARPLHSNDLLDATYVFNDREVLYNTGVRYRGSPWGRPERTSYRVRFPRNRYIHYGLASVNLSSRVNGPVESASYHLTGRCGTVDKPASVPLYHFVRTRFNGADRGTQRFIEPVDRRYLDRWFEGSDGPTLKAVARLAFNDAGQHVGYDGASFDDMGPNPENYRYYYYHTVNRSRDDWSSVAQLMAAMDPRTSSNAVHDATIGDILDLEGFLRVMVARVFVSDWDTLGIGQGHNAYLIFDTRDGLWETAPFDYNQAMPLDQVSFPVFPTFDPGWARLISRPATRRLYGRIASEFLAGYWSAAVASPFWSALERDVKISMSDVRSFVPSRASVMRNGIQSLVNVPLRVVTNDGNDFSVTAAQTLLRGDAPASIALLFYQRNGFGLVELPVSWETPTRWQATLPTPASRNELEILGFEGDGDLKGSVSIVITNTASNLVELIRGDATSDGAVDLADAVRILFQLFAGASIACEDASDVNDDGQLSIADPIRLLDHLFRSGPAPPAPYPGAGEDATADGLGCGE